MKHRHDGHASRLVASYRSIEERALQDGPFQGKSRGEGANRSHERSGPVAAPIDLLPNLSIRAPSEHPTHGSQAASYQGVPELPPVQRPEVDALVSALCFRAGSRGDAERLASFTSLWWRE